jgi:hypothetical protein
MTTFGGSATIALDPSLSVVLFSFSVSDPDWIRIQSGQWIRIRIRNWEPEAKNDPQKKKKIKKFHVLKCWMFSIEGRRLLM